VGPSQKKTTGQNQGDRDILVGGEGQGKEPGRRGGNKRMDPLLKNLGGHNKKKPVSDEPPYAYEAQTPTQCRIPGKEMALTEPREGYK